MRAIIEQYDPVVEEYVPTVSVRLEDFVAIIHGAEYASTDVDYIKQFKITSMQIIEALSRTDKLKEAVVQYLANTERKHSEDYNVEEDERI